ncbi:hypothetical protein LTR66_000898 [Elasticomyces elasticus]|nr:hypothetical protein LTR66_000898 [Elasticomyces elasticus]
MSTNVSTHFPQMWNVFGGSIYRDDYKGNFEESARYIEEARRSAPNAVDLQAGFEILDAILQTLIGNIHDASAILDKVCPSATDQPTDENRRAQIYRQLIDCNGSILSGLDNSLPLYDFHRCLATILEPKIGSRDPDFMKLARSIDLAENQFVLVNVHSPLWRLMAARKWEPDLIARLDLMCQSLSAFEKGLLTNFSSLFGRTRKLMAQCAHLRNPELSIQLLDQAEENCDGTSAMQWDPAEDSYEVENMDSALEHYEAAMTLYEQTHAVRGQAAVLLRKACLILIPLMFGRKQELDASPDPLTELRNILTEASRYCRVSGDTLLLRLVDVQTIFLDVLQSTARSPHTAAADIGKWGKASGSIQYTHDLGILLLRAGNAIWRRRRSVDPARLCFENALAIFSELGDKGGEVQAEAAIATILSDTFDLAAATQGADKLDSSTVCWPVGSERSLELVLNLSDILLLAPSPSRVDINYSLLLVR